jgi:predicted nucleotidyltransferase
VCFYSDLKEILAKRIDVLTTAQLDDKFLESISNEELKIYDAI